MTIGVSPSPVSAGRQILNLEVRQAGRFATGLDRPLLPGLQFLLPEQSTFTFCTGLPFQRPDFEPRVSLLILNVIIDSRHQSIKGGLKVIDVTKTEPLNGFQRFWGLLTIKVVAHDRDDALMMQRGMVQLLQAVLRGQRIWADYENEGIGSLNPLLNLLPPVRGRGNADPIYPGRKIATLQSFVQGLHKALISAGIGDEDVGHGASG